MATIKLCLLTIAFSSSIILPSTSSRSATMTTLDKVKLLEFSMTINPRFKRIYESQVKKVMLPLKKILPEFVISSCELASYNILHWNKIFFVAGEDGSCVQVENHNVEECLKNIPDTVLNKMILDGKLCLTQSSNGKFNIKYHPLLRGGGILGGKIAYWATKSLCWAVVGAVTAATAGKALIVGAKVGGAYMGMAPATITKTVSVIDLGAKTVFNGVGSMGTPAAKMGALVISNSAEVAPALLPAATEATAALIPVAATHSGGLIGLIEALSWTASALVGGATGPV